MIQALQQKSHTKQPVISASLSKLTWYKAAETFYVASKLSPFSAAAFSSTQFSFFFFPTGVIFVPGREVAMAAWALIKKQRTPGQESWGCSAEDEVSFALCTSLWFGLAPLPPVFLPFFSLDVYITFASLLLTFQSKKLLLDFIPLNCWD